MSLILRKPEEIEALGSMELGLVVDQSSSMRHLQGSVIKGFNYLIAEQRDAKVSTLFFDDGTSMLYAHQPCLEVAPLNEASYVPDGSTALLDGIGDMLDQIGAVYDQAGEPPRVLIAILTDGAENNSSRHLLKDVTRTILGRKLQGWKFLFMCANEVGEAYGRKLGIYNVIRFTAKPEELQEEIQKASQAIRHYHKTGRLQLGN